MRLQINVELFELCSGQCLGQVLAIKEGFDLQSDAHLAGQGTLGALDFTLQLAHSAQVGSDVLAAVLSLPKLDKVVNDTVVEVFTTEMTVKKSQPLLALPAIQSEPTCHQQSPRPRRRPHQ